MNNICNVTEQRQPSREKKSWLGLVNFLFFQKKFFKATILKQQVIIIITVLFFFPLLVCSLLHNSEWCNQHNNDVIQKQS